ncbi:Mitochondrial RNA pseudouridine synthase Rpusd4 [Varanus komodoensis]|uniref:Pseudouridylate synthase RPUSD4, mitochondrial n=1 Tax=Varanus komodoensis TaxID=61221 RepID=A0A8D2IMS2_VARKO|nr:mitochondrial RNA pseudouridine synthase RPUSD4 [Varanus komodoensis]KAF7242096.1 Mitochondrial RNA pseudouridine synthase Rpusd4 [Varanus komodoensis]
MAARSGVRLLGFVRLGPARRSFSRAPALAAPPTAEQLAEKMRAQKREQQNAQKQIPKDSVQRRVQELAQLTEQLKRVHPNVLAKALKRGLLYQDENIVVINKPYGIPVHGGPRVKRCISDVLPILAKMLDGMKAEPLHLCHRLDKETTGVMVLARDQGTAHQVQEIFRTRQVEKKYWAICIGQPDPSEGLVEIPIVEKEVKSQQKHHKMTLAPNYRISDEDGKVFKVRKHRDAHVAVTKYKVLSSYTTCSLLELQPVTGVKHQLRVHLAYGIGCPVLGDHKYSHWSKLAPQKLPVGTLKRLGLEQTKARHLPLHLHACQLILPDLNGNGEKKINLVCKPPLFFLRSLKRLKLKHPRLEEQ